MTMVNHDYDLEEGVTRDGVSCDFCHTLTAVHLDGPDATFTAEPGRVKRSVLRNTSSPAHEVAYSELHASADLCGGCHNYTAANGTPIMSTYDEWRTGPYPDEGIRCQDCHMKRSVGRVVRRDVQESDAEFHLHDLIHDTAQIQSALEVEVLDSARQNSLLNVQVAVRNVGSGHMVPTGMPSREVVLRVSVEAGGRTLVRERHYRRVIADEDGRPLSRDHEIMLHGAKILSDNRIGPREERREWLTFDVGDAEPDRIDATVSYVYVPMVLDQRRLDILLSEDVYEAAD